MALPLVLLVMVVLTILVAAAIATMRDEFRIRASQETAVGALVTAQAGLELFLARRDSLGFSAAPPGVSESVRIRLVGGYADVVATQVRNDTLHHAYGYLIRSHGVLAGAGGGGWTVAEYAVWKPGSVAGLVPYTNVWMDEGPSSRR